MKHFSVAGVLLLITVLTWACAPSQLSADPDSVVQAFYDALNERDLDRAMGLVAEDAKFITFTVSSGQAEIRESLQKSIDRNTRYEVDNFQVDGDTVTWILRATADFVACERTMQAVVQNVKIEFLKGDCT